MPALYVDVIIPLAVKHTYTYSIPSSFERQVQFGIRLEVPFGKKKIFAGLAINVHANKPAYPTRKVLSIIDDSPVITTTQLDLWLWIAEYYLCDLGEVMYAAMPGKLKLQSETMIKPGKSLDEVIFDLSDQEYMIAEAVSIQRQITIDQIRSILNIKTVYPIIKRLLDLGVIEVNEELTDAFKPKIVVAVRLVEAFRNNKEAQKELFELVAKSDHQTRAMLVIVQQSNQKKIITQAEVIRIAEVSSSVILALEKKGLIERYEQTVSRLINDAAEFSDQQPLTTGQAEVLEKMRESSSQPFKPTLLHGVTGSGKTRIYLELMHQALAAGRQVLYLLPEIALTTQIVQRLKKVIGEDLLVYHSRINDNQRVEIWKEVLGLPRIVLAARSGIFLPFSDLGLVIVDEEHDPSYKQEEPNPRYQARDSAIFLAKLHQASIVLGSATPSIESFWNAMQGRYHYLKMPDRFGNLPMPEITLIDMKKGARSGHLSNDLIDEMRRMKAEGFQTILFQNRRGFAPLLMCTTCGWTTSCKNCDTSLTYHQYSNQMQCHICGYHEKPAIRCPACGNPELTLKGFGTEMIEEEVKILLPDHTVARLDLDTARGKKQLERILYQFENSQIDVLIGTQMISKGLDFEKVGLVGIISADHLMHYPDFRASERAFQLMVQVGGRSGRKHRRGLVMIQALHTTHPVLAEVIASEYYKFYAREIEERKAYGFPPFSRLIVLTLKHSRSDKTDAAADAMSNFLRQRLGKRVHGPLKPSVARVRNRYLALIVIKLEKKAALIDKCKNWIEESELLIKKQKGFSTLRVNINVDP
jgi:primosomal protein N' (replication factor Y)